MSTSRVSTPRFILPFLTVLACALLALPALADSQARIVRLSDVQGSVRIDKNTGLGFENAFLNLPITQGTQLETRGSGRAEIEFEDGSTVRLAPDTRVEFSTLGLSDSGQRISVVNLVEGMAYVNWLGKSDAFTLNFSREKVELDHPAHIRVETSPSLSKFAVFKGEVIVDGPSGKVTVDKKKMATFDGDADDKYTLAKLEESPLDSWDKQALDYHQQYAKNNSSPYGYGYSDLNYYGGFQNIAGYGMMWQPFFTGIGWDPFMDGAWSWYPGYGYTYVSAYPWVWLPYRYGNWLFVPGFGWMWQPGYASMWNTVPRYTATTAVRVHPLIAPSGTVHTVAVGRGGPVTGTTFPSRLIVSKGSAGMGIQRGSVQNLGHLNGQVAKAGSAEVRPAPQFGATTSARSASAYGAPHSGMSSGASMGHSAGSATASHSSGGGGGHHN